MFYFIGNTLTHQITGIESAQLKRLRLFAQFGEPAKYVSCGTAVDRTPNARKFGLTADHYVNMIDFLCEIPFAYQREATVASLPFAHQYRVSHQDASVIRYAEGSHVVAEVHQDPASHQLVKVYYYDEHNQSRVEELYDPRGFVSVRFFFDAKLRVMSKVYLTPAGEWRIRILYTDAPTRRVAGVQVRTASGRIVQLAGVQDLRRYFFDRLNQSTPRNIFVCDRTRQNAWALENMRTHVFKVFQMHNVHAVNLVNTPASTEWNFNYRQPLDNLAQWNGALVLTDQQLADITLNLPAAKFYKMPAVVIAPERLAAPRVPLAARTPGKLIAVARIDRQKQLKELVQVVNLVHQVRPNVTLDIWGLVQEEKYKQEIEALIAQLHLGAVVKLRGFATDINAAYDHAQLMILTSRVEGTILALAEAQSHGVPVVSYDFKYGPQEFIEPGVNGDIVAVGARQAAADAALRLLGDDALWQRYSDGCYAESHRYSAAKVFAYWQRLKATGAAFYGEKG